jgi:2-methylisocitrate lyase-like PEP mutase family enzyme
MPADATYQARDFLAQHQRGTFLMPNAWDAGSAKYLAACGFAALGTTSAGIAFAAGHRDSDPRQSVDAMFAAIASIVAAVSIPVSADLEAGFGDSLDDVQRTFTRAIAIGCAGGSLEDVADYATPGQFVLRSRQDAIERVCAARAAIDQHATPFVLTARTECFLTGHPSPLAEAIDRLCAFRDAGADCLFAPGISQPADIATLVREVNAPLNVLTAGPAAQLTLAQLRDLGVRRISTGSALARAAFTALHHAANDMLNKGSFAYAGVALSGEVLDGVMGEAVE